MKQEEQLVGDRMHSRGGLVSGSAVLPASGLTICTNASALSAESSVSARERSLRHIQPINPSRSHSAS
jgi:hypothetical protein